jgi:hypothetical protein
VKVINDPFHSADAVGQWRRNQDLGLEPGPGLRNTRAGIITSSSGHRSVA